MWIDALAGSTMNIYKKAKPFTSYILKYQISSTGHTVFHVTNGNVHVVRFAKISAHVLNYLYLNMGIQLRTIHT